MSVQLICFIGGFRGGAGGLDPHGKSQVAIGFLRHSGTNYPREAIGPLGSNCFSREVHTALSALSKIC